MPNKKYISINGDSDGLQERSLRADVGEFAYVDRKRIADTFEDDVLIAPFEPALLPIGSHRFRAASWSGVTNPPIKLPPNGHFAVLVADGITKTVTYIADTTAKDGCLVTRCAELVVIDGAAETWNYYVSVSETENNGAIAVPSGYDKGRALDTSRKAAPAAYVQQYAHLNRGTRSGQINFNSSLLPGNSQVTFDATSIAAPPTNQNAGVLRNEVAGCVVFQYWYPDNSPSLFFRERSAAKIWTDWEQATEGNLVSEGIVYVPSYARRGIGTGRQMVPVYSAAQANQKFRIIPGYGINVTDTPSGTIVSWSGSSSAIGADAPLNYNPSTNRVSLDSAKISQWDTAYSYGPHVGLYAPAGRTLSIAGAAGRVAVTGGTQSLAADRSWSVDLATVHAGLSAGSSTQVAAPVVDVYGRVTSMSAVSIAFPVTSVNGKTGAVSLSTTDVPEGTNLYWTTTRGDARYVQLSGSYSNPTWLASFDYSKITNVPDYGGMYVPIVRTLSFLGAAGQIAITGGSQSLVSNRTWTIGLETVHAGLLAGSSTQVAAPVVDVYGRVTSMSSVSIAFPVTSVNGKTGAVSLSTTDVPEGTNLYWTTTRGDARYVQLSGSYSNPTWLASFDYSKITNTPDFAGLYVPIVRNLTVSGTTGRVAVTGGTQSLASSRTWTVDLATVHTGLSGGSTITTPALTVDAYGRVTAMTYSTILFPVTSVNSKTGAVVLNTDDVAEGVTNQYFTTGRARAAFTAGAGISITGGVISATSSGSVSGTGTATCIPKWTSSSALGNSQIYDNGSGVIVGGTDPGSYKFRVNGAIYSDGDGSAVAMYISAGRAIRSLGEMYIDSPGGNTYFRNGSGLAYSMTLNPSGYVLMGTVTAVGTKTLQVNGGIRATGQMQFANYTSAVSYIGSRAGLLGFTSSGDIISVADTDFALSYHNHDDRYFTKNQLIASGGGGQIHWNNITNVPSFGTAPHTHPISEITGLQPALDNRPTWDAIYTRSQSDARYLQGESDPFGFDSHWFSVAGSLVTLGIQRRNGSQQYANFTVPSSGGGSDYSINLSPFPPGGGLGNHQLNLVKSGGGGNSVSIYEQDPKGVSYLSMSLSGGILTVTIVRRDGSTTSDSVNFSS